MLRHERLSVIMGVLRAHGTVSTEDLATRLSVSAETVRRDLVELERRGAARRVHGGVTVAGSWEGQEPSFDTRSTESQPAKDALAQVAAAQVSSGQTLILDVGTTALAVARALPKSFRGTVATCSLLVAGELAGRPGVELLVSGGHVRGGDLALSNATTVAFFADLHADLAFLGSGGVDIGTGLTDYHLDEIAARRVMIENSRRSLVLADAQKFGRVAPHTVCPLAKVTAVVTDVAPPPRMRSAARRLGVSMLWPGHATLAA